MGNGPLLESRPGVSPRRRPFLKRLARDARGNTLAIVGAALIPLTAMIGSGIDLSRAYMAKARLQSACDAASLAGRRVMTNDTLNATVRNEALRFFNFNFSQGLYGTAAFTPVVTRPAQGVVAVSASTRIPTGIMYMFGFPSLPVRAECEAAQNFVNTDIVLVLDVTGSMAETLSGTTKIVALRDAVMALYDELRPVQTELEANGLRLRYGIVPYSSAVNVGHLIYAANPAYIANNVNYQSRLANYSTLDGYDQTGSSTQQFSETSGLTLNTNTLCNAYGANRSYPTLDGAGPFNGGSQASGETTSTTYSVRDRSGGTCRRWRTVVTTTWAPRYRHTDSSFRQMSYDTSAFKTGATVRVANDSTSGTVRTAGTYSMAALPAAGTGVGWVDSRWNGCIEERQTVSTITASSGYSIPSGARDLDINLIPNSDETRWRPHWPEISYRRTAGSAARTSGTWMPSLGDPAWYACPSEARRLRAWSRTDMQNYVNSLQTIGGTYHDIGMIWGARLISSAGIFADSPDTFGSMPVARHIIFMTDGQMAPNNNSYSSYGIEINDMRVTGASNTPQQLDRHNQRFKMICNATKSMDVSIWVIAFGTTLNSDLTECASSENQASTSGNRAQLMERFTEIGKNIGALRLTH